MWVALLTNGVWLLVHIEDKEVVLMNFFAGGVGLFVCISLPSRAQITELLPFEELPTFSYSPISG